MRRTRQWPTAHAAAISLASGLLGTVGIAGPLDPPPGAVAPTGRTLGQVEPRLPINQENTPGDSDSIYRISEPGSYYLTGNVMGQFNKTAIEIASSNVTIDLMGFTMQGVDGSDEGIKSSGGAVSNITIRNGVITDFDRSGINLLSGGTGRGSLIESIHAADNIFYGILTGDSAIVRSCQVSGNGLAGIRTGSSAVITHCSARQNDGEGIDANSGSTVRHCNAYNNGTTGILLGLRSSVTDCDATLNLGDGIAVNQECLVRGNNCVDNLGSGILVMSSANRIESNNCIDNDRGIKVDFAGNFIAKNTCANNDTFNWQVVADNHILVVNAVNAGAMTGGSGGVSPGSTDPCANYSY